MNASPDTLEQVDPQAFRFYVRTLGVLQKAEVPFLVGGAYALAKYTGIVRHTKDFDLFTRRADAPRALAALAAAGYRTEMTFPHWLGKAFHGDYFIDVIFNSGNGQCTVDDGWFAHAHAHEVLGVAVQLAPAEEIIWQKAFIMERERFDGADLNHLLRARGHQLDWDRLLARFGENWRVLLAHLILFGFVYPTEEEKVPARVVRTLTDRLRSDPPAGASGSPVCRGTLLSRMQYLTDTEEWGYCDARLPPSGAMTAEQITHWTAAAEK